MNNYNDNIIVTKDKKIYNIYTIDDIESITRIGENDFLISDKALYSTLRHKVIPIFVKEDMKMILSIKN